MSIVILEIRLNRRICDQLVLGINDNKIQRGLWEAGLLEMDEALDIAKGLEAAKKGVAEPSRVKQS